MTTKKELTQKIAELQAQADAMPDDERELTDIEVGESLYLLADNGSVERCNAGGERDHNTSTFSQLCRSRSKEQVEAMAKYRKATTRFAMKCHEVNLGDDGAKDRELLFGSCSWTIMIFMGDSSSYKKNPLSIYLSEKGAKKLIEWCEREYPNGLAWEKGDE